jgi:hypothetical protein
MWLARFALFIAMALSPPVRAQEGQSAEVFVFGNSLIHHLTDEGRSNVPYWLARLAEAEGHSLRLDGTWGFVRDFARDLPPEPNWSFEGVERVMTGGEGFRRAGFDTILINPANFIQGRRPDQPYEGDNPTGDSPLSATLRVLDWASANAPGARLFVYEGWALMSSVTRYPPNARGLRRYHRENMGFYHDWYVDYVDAIRAARPEMNIELIPVASALSRVLSETSLSELDGTVFYEDEAPHGTEALYFLAALATYSAIYGEPPPVFGALADGLPPEIAADEAMIRRILWEEVSGAIIPDQARLDIPETGFADPSLAMGLAGISDWSTQHPFLDLMKTARPWIGHLPGQWGGVTFDDLQAAGHLSPEGWPVSLPQEVEAIEAFILTDQPEGALSLSGRYRVTWQGRGDLSLGGLARNVARHDNGGLSFDYRPGPGLVAVRITSVDPEDPIRDIRIFREDRTDLIEAGALFDPAFVATIRDLRSIRFMDWMDTNNSDQVMWAERPRLGDFTYVWRGVPVEIMVQLANRIGAEPWFTLPHMADDAYVRAFATHVRDHLDPRLPVRVEWSNEVWNFIFEQARWAADQAEARWGMGVPDDAWMQFAGLRGAEVARIWIEVFGPGSDRVIPVVSVHTGWPGLEKALLEAPLAVAEGLPPPAEAFRAYAVTGYFGAELGDEINLDELREWAAAENGVAQLAEAARVGSLAMLAEELWPHHAGVARSHGYEFIMYEGGTHVTGHGATTQDDIVTAFLAKANYSPEMARLYDDLLFAWADVGGSLFNAFVDTAPPSRWGSWGARRHLGDVNPRAVTLQAHASTPGPVESMAYLHGVYRAGSTGDDDHSGTPEEDLLIGGPGDDIFRPGAGHDLINGGPGEDVVYLAGRPDQWRSGWNGNRLLVQGPDGFKSMVGIERLHFPEVDEDLLIQEPET